MDIRVLIADLHANAQTHTHVDALAGVAVASGCPCPLKLRRHSPARFAMADAESATRREITRFVYPSPHFPSMEITLLLYPSPPSPSQRLAAWAYGLATDSDH